MTTSEVLKEKTYCRRGYMPVSIFEHKTAPVLLDWTIKLQIVPSKISAYFKRELIEEVFKQIGCCRVGVYYIKLTDGSFLEVEY